MTPEPSKGAPGPKDNRWRLVEATMRRHGHKSHALIEALHSAQEAYGFLENDVLRMVARTLRHAARASDFLGRWGGEEFLALLPNASEGEVRLAAERFRTLVESSALRLPSGLVGVTASVGATLARPEDTPETVVSRADALMYEAKRGGRNRVVAEV